eukprot:m51a1_g14662 hypothetical protein (348) ;mRNA; r:15797-17298
MADGSVPVSPRRCAVVFAVEGAVLGSNESLGIGGNVEALGKGTPIPMVQNDENPSRWQAQVEIPCGVLVEYRYAIMNDYNTKLAWEQARWLCSCSCFLLWPTLEIPSGVVRLELDDLWGTGVDRAVHVGLARRGRHADVASMYLGSGPCMLSTSASSPSSLQTRARLAPPLVSVSPGAFASASPVGGERARSSFIGGLRSPPPTMPVPTAPSNGAALLSSPPQPPVLSSPPQQPAHPHPYPHPHPHGSRSDGDVLFTGYLTKLGERMKSWKRRFFILTTSTLLYYIDSTKITPKGKITITEISGVKLTTLAGKEDKFAFEVITKRNKEAERTRWIDEFRKLHLPISQ